jgi:hypothetical protein
MVFWGYNSAFFVGMQLSRTQAGYAATWQQQARDKGL